MKSCSVAGRVRSVKPGEAEPLAPASVSEVGTPVGSKSCQSETRRLWLQGSFHMRIAKRLGTMELLQRDDCMVPIPASAKRK